MFSCGSESDPPMLFYLPGFRPLFSGSGASGCFVCCTKVWRLVGERNGIEGHPFALHLAAFFFGGGRDPLDFQLTVNACRCAMPHSTHVP